MKAQAMHAGCQGDHWQSRMCATGNVAVKNMFLKTGDNAPTQFLCPNSLLLQTDKFQNCIKKKKLLCYWQGKMNNPRNAAFFH